MVGKVAQISLPPKLVDVFAGEARYRGAYGGRGSAKTRSFAQMAAVKGYELSKNGEAGLILCGRQYMNSLSESSFAEVEAAIKAITWLDAHYEIGEKFIRTKDRRIEFGFVGLTTNLDSIKSKARVHLLWVDEAENVSESAWQKAIPTVREHNSEIWITWNPESETSATHKRFREQKPDDAKIVEMNWRDNPWFPDVLNKARLEDRDKRPDDYHHVWEGGFKTISEAQVFKGKYRISEFDIGEHWDGPYQGGDFGFSKDPTAAVRCYVNDNILYITHEAYKVHLDLDHTASFIMGKIPNFDKHVTRWDSARPESISYLKRHGFPKSIPCKKWPGSVIDGVGFLRSFDEIVIHERCKNLANEFMLYSYEVDKRTGDIKNSIEDKNNHGIDALRYAVGPMIRVKKKQQAASFGNYGRTDY